VERIILNDGHQKPSESEKGLGCVKTPLVMQIGGLWQG
jgi:hypothetical protein